MMKQKILILINDAPYGTEKAYNALRLAMQLGKDHSDTEVQVFLMADAANCALANQNTPNGYYNIERMLKAVLAKGGKVKICGGCAEARGLKNAPLIEGTEISTMAELANWVTDSDKVITF
ncbi:MAG: DsrE family protein [Bacteroidales bacterium]|nr:DsrE family protein [Bacteroidales bacterium]